MVEFFATFFIWFLFVGLGILWIVDGKIKREQVAHAIFAGLFACGLAILIKHLIPAQRPFMVNGGEVDVLYRPLSSSFPSEHTALAFSLAVTVFMHDRKVGWYFLAAALLIGIARVIANVHYPIDIVGGAFLGITTAVIVERVHLFKLITSRRIHS